MTLTAAMIVFFVLAGVTLAAADGRHPRIYGATKFAASLSLLIIAGTTQAGRFGQGILAALVAAALGDAALVRKQDARFFLAGVVFFLTAHIAYSVAFFSTALAGSIFAIVPGGVAAGVVATRLLRRVGPGVPAHLRPVVNVYAAAIVVMFAAACGAATGGLNFLPRVAVLAGATLFFAGDMVFSINQFDGPIPRGQTVSMALYWTGQLMIALAARSLSVTAAS